MSTVTLYTDAKALVDDLNNLRRGEKTFLYTHPSFEYVPVVLSISEYEFETAHASGIIIAKKVPVS